jgi:hypothetical protein
LIAERSNLDDLVEFDLREGAAGKHKAGCKPGRKSSRKSGYQDNSRNGSFHFPLQMLF